MKRLATLAVLLLVTGPAAAQYQRVCDGQTCRVVRVPAARPADPPPATPPAAGPVRQAYYLVRGVVEARACPAGACATAGDCGRAECTGAVTAGAPVIAIAATVNARAQVGLVNLDLGGGGLFARLADGRGWWPGKVLGRERPARRCR